MVVPGGPMGESSSNPQGAGTVNASSSIPQGLGMGQAHSQQQSAVQSFTQLQTAHTAEEKKLQSKEKSTCSGVGLYFFIVK